SCAPLHSGAAASVHPMIRGTFDYRLGGAGPAPIVPVVLFVPDRTTGAPSIPNFLLDSGAAETCLVPADARIAGYAAEYREGTDGWTHRRSAGVRGIGGGVEAFRDTVSRGFVDDGLYVSWLDIEMNVAQATEATEQLPSVL